MLCKNLLHWKSLKKHFWSYNFTIEHSNGLETFINHYKNNGIHLNKLIVGLPHYGAEWYTKKPEKDSIVTRFKSHPPYKSIREFYIDSLNTPIQFDLKSAPSYIVIKDSVNSYLQLFLKM